MVRVVVTGLGAVSCLGNSVDEFWNNLIAGKSGITNIQFTEYGNKIQNAALGEK